MTEVHGDLAELSRMAEVHDLQFVGRWRNDNRLRLHFHILGSCSLRPDSLCFQASFVVAYPAMTTATQQQLQTFDLCFNISGVENPKYPSFSIMFRNDVSFFPHPQNYLVEVAPDVKCLAMQGLQFDFSFNTIGNMLQRQNFLVIYDRQSSMIGLAPSSYTTSSE
jgi:hypothetical protein